jgi:hypothetical protein
VGDEGVLERTHPVKVALDGEWILPDECLLDRFDAVARQLGVDSRFAVAGQPESVSMRTGSRRPRYPVEAS